MVIVLEYEVDDVTNPETLARIGEALLQRAVHEPLETARHIRSYVAIREPADEIIDILGGPMGEES